MRPRAAHALNVFACEPEWGSLLHELAGDKIERRRRHDRAAGRARDRGQAEPDREGAPRRPRRLHRRRTRSRLAAAADPAGRQPEGRIRARATSWPPTRSRRSRSPPRSIAPMATSIRRAIRISRWIRTACSRSPRRSTRAWPSSIRPTRRRTSRRLADFTHALAGGDQGLGSEGRAAEGHARSSCITGAGSTCDTWLGMEQIGALEPKPGVPPTSAHLASLIDLTKARTRSRSCAPRTRIPKPGEWLAERTGVPAVMLPFTVGGDDAVQGSVRPVRFDHRQAAGGAAK